MILGSGVKHAYSHPKRQEADEQHYQHQSSSSSALAAGTGQPQSAAGSILPTQQQLHEIYEENLRLREEVVKSSTAGSSTAEATGM